MIINGTSTIPQEEFCKRVALPFNCRFGPFWKAKQVCNWQIRKLIQMLEQRKARGRIQARTSLGQRRSYSGGFGFYGSGGSGFPAAAMPQKT
jgi:hypothetical protein